VQTESSVAIFGAGGVGLSTVLGACLVGASRIIAMDRLSRKCEMALEMGATDALLAGGDSESAGDGAAVGSDPSSSESHGADINDRIRKLTGGRGADYVFDTTGVPAVQEQCLDAARPGGVVVLAGLAPMGSATNLPGAIFTRQEKTVMGTYYGTANPMRDFPLCVDLYLEGRLDLDRLITAPTPWMRSTRHTPTC